MELGIDILVILRMKVVEKIGVALGILALIAGAYWYFLFTDRTRDLEKVEKTVQSQVDAIAAKRRMLARLPELRKELIVLKGHEERLARKLPSKKEIPVLLTDISTAGHEQGLEFLLFAPQPELERDVYAEVPVSLRVQGPFHETALFVNQLAKLSRIVTVSDIVMVPGDKKGIEDKGLVTTAQATTYRFLEQEEAAEAAQKAKKAKKK